MTERIVSIICIPLLMFSDYYLTLLGKKLRDNVYLQHISTEEYELNPVWQKDINKFKMFNYKHVLAVILITGYFYFASLVLRDSWYYGIYGALFTMYAYIIMRHLNNILIYRFANRNPNLFSGKATYGLLFSLNLSKYQSFTYSVFMLALFAWTQSWFILGGAIGLALLGLTNIRWINTYKKKALKKSAETNIEQQPKTEPQVL
jgi:hypothetical protein